MGMAASQARLLAITARMHDVEFEAQTLQNAKLQLSTQQDAVYEEYQKALDAVTLTYLSGYGNNATNVAATFNTLFSANAAGVFSNKNYVLIDSRGRVVVDQEVEDGYIHFKDSAVTQSAYAFAAYMLYGDPEADPLAAGGVFDTSMYGDPNSFLSIAYSVFSANWSTDETLRDLYEASTDERSNVTTPGNGGIIPVPGVIYGEVIHDNAIVKALKKVPNDRAAYNMSAEMSASPSINGGGNGGGSDEEDYESTPPSSDVPMTPDMDAFSGVFNNGDPDSQAFINYFMNRYRTAIFNNESFDSQDYDKFNYYVSIYNAIEQHGGCIAIQDYNGLNGEVAANSTEWLTNMINSGVFTIEIAQINNNGSVNLSGTGVDSDVHLNYTQTSQIDRAALARAEAKYEHELKKIDKKDKMYDMQLTKLETERKALDTQRESLKKVIEDNVKNTFGIFS